jgi:hypothetical protein
VHPPERVTRVDGVMPEMWAPASVVPVWQSLNRAS